MRYYPMQILALKTCNQDISKTVTASSFKHGQLIKDNEYETWRKCEKSNFIFSSYYPLQISALKTCNQDISKTITANSFKLGQLIEVDE